MTYYLKIRNGLFFAMLISKMSCVNGTDINDLYSASIGQRVEAGRVQLTYDPKMISSDQMRDFEKISSQFNVDLIPINSNKRVVRLLSLDGGGTRGFKIALYLHYLTQITQKPIHELFDAIIGTSTGTLMASAFGIKRRVEFRKVIFNESFVNRFGICNNIIEALKEKFSKIDDQKILPSEESVSNEAKDAPKSTGFMGYFQGDSVNEKIVSLLKSAQKEIKYLDGKNDYMNSDSLELFMKNLTEKIVNTAKDPLEPQNNPHTLYINQLSERPLAPFLKILNGPSPASAYYTPQDMLMVYLQDSPIIFTKKGVLESGGTYTDRYLIDFLQKYFGDITLDELAISTYFTAHDAQSGSPFIFSRYAAIMDPSENIPVWKVIRGATAAPTYFDPYEINGKTICDGGIDFNNPAPMGIFRVAQEFNIPDTQILTLSLGTGNPNLKNTHEHFVTLGQVGWGMDLLVRLFSGKKSELLMMEKYLSHVSKENLISHYFRICPEIEAALMKTDRTDQEFFQSLEEISYKEIVRLKRDFAHFGAMLAMQNFEAPSLPVPLTPMIPPRNPLNLRVIEIQGVQEIGAGEKKSTLDIQSQES